MIASRALQDAVGVTRVARVTGLDRSGVEVACAVRPFGHVLQVSNGKGLTFAQASLGAVLEAAELTAAESVEPERLVYGSVRALRRRFGARTVWAPGELGSAEAFYDGRLDGEDVVFAFSEAVELFAHVPVLVPAQAVHCPPAGTVDLGPLVVGWTTNGGGAHPTREAALLHALLEAIERDQLARCAPEGWTPELVLERMVSPSSLARGAPKTARLVEQLRSREFEVALFDLSVSPREEGGVGLPVAGALLFDLTGGPIPLTAGYACRLDADDALFAAALEAAQSRLTDIHGARDDVQHGQTPDPQQRALLSLVRSAGGSRAAGALPRVRGADPVNTVLSRMRRAGFSRGAAVAVEPEGFPVHVVKVVVPGFQVSELLL